ncbi:DUF4269 domain-containing protein [Brevibacillus sp. SAFN-007a]|uniref:DUF4269 domain-containing protein n=1 Tax=Brevibacillus sp. SAFN-007a TaxID=3436862 RepID=UPI003F7EEAA0
MTRKRGLSMTRNWRDLSYLHSGTPKQKAAGRAIEQSAIMQRLQAFDPVLTGTIPLDIDIATSDLDIICESHDLDQFAEAARASYATHEGYKEARLLVQDVPTCLIAFFAYGFWFELFAQPRPIEQQNAYRHMVVEHRLLLLGGADALRGIRQFKQNGLKTEPAFASYFNISGDDPYQALLDVEKWTDEQLRALVGRIRMHKRLR